MSPKEERIEKRTIAVLVDNESGVLARVIGLFSGRGYNIESLTVTEVDPKERLSRITIVTSGTPQVLEQIKAQLEHLGLTAFVCGRIPKDRDRDQEQRACHRKKNGSKKERSPSWWITSRVCWLV